MAGDDLATVLYVDDEPINLRVFTANFRARFPILTAGSGEQALELLQRGDPRIGVILTDQRMPGLSGAQLLEKSRELAPDAHRMLLTAYSDMQAVIDAVNKGQVTRYFVKPWVKEELLAAIEDALRIYGLQEKLRGVEGRLLQSERLATLGQVSAGIAHELVNPVSYVSQNIDALRGQLDQLVEYVRRFLPTSPDENVSQVVDDLPSLLNDVETGTEHIKQIAVGIRTQVRGEDTEKDCDLAEVVQFASKIARAQVQPVARLAILGEPTRVRGGSVKLTQVLINLIVNSAHAIEGIGRPGLIEVSWTRERDGGVRLEVRDNGKGIPANLLEKVFEPLFTTKPVGQGTGLGLPICRQIVSDVGGELTLSSTEGVGTTVDIKLKPAGP